MQLSTYPEIRPLARRILTDVDWDEIDTAFADGGDPQFGAESRAEFRALMSRIVNQAPEPVGFGLIKEAKPEPEAHPVLLSIHDLSSHY